MPKLRIAITITTESALSVGAAGSAGSLADKSIVRDGLGRPIIPGSQLKGKLRYAAEQLLRSLGQDIPSPFELGRVENDTLIRRVFGSPDQPSPLRFADLIGDLEPQLARLPSASAIRPSVTINRRRGTAEDQRLLLQEVTREGLAFRADPAISGNLGELSYAALLWAALRLTDRWGGAKSRGLGWATATAAIYLDEQPLDEPELARALQQIGRPV